MGKTGKQQDMADLGGNGVRNDPRHLTEGAGHPGRAKGRSGTLFSDSRGGRNVRG